MEKINFSVISQSGDDEYSLVPTEALQKIRAFANKGKWLYLDGEYTNTDTISESDLIKANHIIMTNTLAGGSSPEFTVLSKISENLDSAPIIIDFDLENRKIEIFLNSFNIQSIAHLAKPIVQSLRFELEKAAVEGVNEIGRAYGKGSLLKNTFTDRGVPFNIHSNWVEDPEHGIKIDYSLESSGIYLTLDKGDFGLIHFRNLIVHSLEKKINEFVKKEIDEARELYNA
jgi:hypothetical protein